MTYRLIFDPHDSNYSIFQYDPGTATYFCVSLCTVSRWYSTPEATLPTIQATYDAVVANRRLLARMSVISEFTPTSNPELFI